MIHEKRYARQQILPEIGAAGQQAFNQANVLIIGLGALGSVQAQLLARAGIGHLTLIDRDVLELNNLQRQMLYLEQDVHDQLPKAAAAKNRLQQINSEIQIEAKVIDCNPSNVESLIEPVDLVLDGTDNFETRYLINDVCIKLNKPWVYGGVIGTQGLCMPIVPTGPCLRCLFPDPPPIGSLPTCDTAGVLNTSVSMIASLQATWAYRLLLNDMPEATRLTDLEIWKNTFHQVNVFKDEHCPCCVQGDYVFLHQKQTDYISSLCGRNSVQITPAKPTTIELDQLAQRLQHVGKVSKTGYLLQVMINQYTLIIFPDGRVMVQGTNNESSARTLVAKYL